MLFYLENKQNPVAFEVRDPLVCTGDVWGRFGLSRLGQRVPPAPRVQTVRTLPMLLRRTGRPPDEGSSRPNCGPGRGRKSRRAGGEVPGATPGERGRAEAEGFVGKGRSRGMWGHRCSSPRESEQERRGP